MAAKRKTAKELAENCGVDLEWVKRADRTERKLFQVLEEIEGIHGGIPWAERIERARRELPPGCDLSCLMQWLLHPPSKPYRRGRGRPRRYLDDEKVFPALAEHGSLRRAAKALGVSKSALARHVAALPPSYVMDWGRRLSQKSERNFGTAVAERHARLLGASAVAPAVAAARGYRTVASGLAIPLWNVDGAKAWTQVRVDKPDRRKNRYKNGRGAHALVDVSPAGRALVLDPERPLYVAESPRKADAAVSCGMACVAVQGVGLISTNAREWKSIGVRGRPVYLVFDADASQNPHVLTAEAGLYRFLRGIGAQVHVIRIPPSYGAKAGLDDVLAAGATEEDLLSWVLTDYAAPERRCGYSRCARPIPITANPQRLYCNKRCREDAATERAMADDDRWITLSQKDRRI